MKPWTAAPVRHLHGDDVARESTDHLELAVRTDPARDPFAPGNRA